MSSPAGQDAPPETEPPRIRHSIWRARGPVGAAARRSLRVRRAVAAVTLVVLAATLYAVLMSPFAHPHLQIAAITTVGADESPRAPSIGPQFAAQDIEAWRSLAVQLAPGSETSPLLTSTAPYRAADLEALQTRLDGQGAGPADVLLLYIRTEGVVHDGVPNLTCAPNSVSARPELLPLTRLLTQVRSCPHGTKLVILDSGATAADPQAGELVNEFPRLVADCVAGTNDPGLWVLLSHGLLESSQALWSRRRSVLVDAVTTGLSGGADRNSDRAIDIDELFRYAANAVTQTTLALSDGQAPQTPQLCWGRGEIPREIIWPVLAPAASGDGPTARIATGTGDAGPPRPEASPANPFLSVAGSLASANVTSPVGSLTAAPSGVSVSIAPPAFPVPPPAGGLASQATAAATAAAAQSAAAPPSTPAAGAVAPGSTGAAAAAPAAGPATVTEAPTAPPVVADAKSTPAEGATNQEDAAAAKSDGIAARVLTLWELRDRLEDRQSRPLSPIDVAPAEWRSLLDDIQTHEFRCRAAAVTDMGAVEFELQDLVAALSEIAEHAPVRSSSENRESLWQALAANAALPPLSVDSAALAEALAARGGASVPPEVGTAWQQFGQALESDDRRALDAWLAALPPEVSHYAEFADARQLAQLPGLDWPLLRDALRAVREGEQAAAQWESADMVRRPTAVGDELRSAAEQMLIDGVEPDRLSRAHALVVQARREYRSALDNAALLARARAAWHDLSFQSPDYVRWWAATGLATYRCGPTVEDVAALLAELQELGRLLLSATADDRDALQLQVGLLAAIVDRLGADKCVRQSLARRPPGVVEETPWQIESMLATLLPRAAHRRHLLQHFADAESLRLAAVPSVAAGAPIPARTMSLRDWHYLQTSAGFQLDLARLAAIGLPDAQTILAPLETGFAAAQSQQSASLENRDAASDDALFQTYRALGAAVAQFRRDLAFHVKRSAAVVPSRAATQAIAGDLTRLEGVLQAQRVAGAELPETGSLSGRELLRLQAAGLLAWQADRAESRAVNADPDRVVRRQETAQRLRQQSGALLGVDPTLLAANPGLSVAAPPVVSLVESAQEVAVTVSNGEHSESEVWLVLEYDPLLIRIRAPAGLTMYHAPELAANAALGMEAAASRAARQQPDNLPVAAGALGGPPLPSADNTFRGTWWSPGITSAAAPSATLGAGQTVTWPLQVQCLGSATHPTRLVIKAVTARHFARRAVEFRTPRPPFAELEVAGIDGAASRDARGLVLHPFPNRETEYRFRLTNTQPVARVVDVSLLSLPAPLEFELPRGTLTADEAAVVLERLTETSVAGRLDQRPLPVAGTAPPADAPPPEEPPAEDPEAAGKQPLPALRYGAVAVIVDHTTRETVFAPIRIEPQRPARYVRPVVRYDLERERIEIVVRSESAAVMPPDGSTVRAAFSEPLDATATFQLDGVLRAPDFETRLYADVTAAPGKVVHLQLHVDDYPRAFRYAVPCDRDSAAVPLSTDGLAITVQPLESLAYQTPIDGIPVSLQFDAPAGAFQTLPTLAEVGLDLDRDRTLRNEPALRLMGDRDVDVRLKKFQPTGALTLTTTIGDYRVRVPAAGMGTGSVNVQARIEASGQVAWSVPQEIMLDGSAPRIDAVELRPGRILSSEQQLQVSVHADDRAESGIARVELTFDVQRSGVFAPDAKIIPAGATAGPAWTAVVPLADLPPGTHGLLVRAIDATGNVSETHREVLTVLSAAAAAERMLGSTSPVAGTALFGELPVAGAAVLLEDDKQQVVAEARTRSDGGFELPRVLPGKYKLKAQGLVKNKVRAADAEVVVPPPPSAVDAVRLQLR